MRRSAVGASVRALVEALMELAWERGCHAMWVLTDDANAGRDGDVSGGGRRPGAESVMFVWDRPDTAPPRRSR